MKKLRITRAVLEACKPCDQKYIDDSPRLERETGDIVFPNGFNELEVARMARDEPVPLDWLVRMRLVPLGLLEAKRLIKLARSTMSDSDIVSAASPIRFRRDPIR